MSSRPINVLQILIGGKTFTGVASYLYQQYLHIDRGLIHYDFLFCRENAMNLVQMNEIFRDSDFISLHAIKGNGKSTDYRAVIKGIRSTLKKKNYSYIVVNTSVVEIILACIFAIKHNNNIQLIAHAHNTELIVSSKSIRKKLAPIVNIGEAIIRKTIRQKADYLFACSEEAGKVTFGKPAVNLTKFHIIRNAIDLSKFRYDKALRDSIRIESGVSSETLIYGNIGSLCVRKNQSYLLDVFNEILQTEPEAVLWLIGDGELKNDLIDKARALGIEDKIVFWGQRSDVHKIIQGMDCFVFTTLSEGLGIVAIEAQAAGLPTIISDGVPEDVVITELCKMISLKEGTKKWAQSIIEFRKEFCDRTIDQTGLINAGYDIVKSSDFITSFFMEHVK